MAHFLCHLGAHFLGTLCTVSILPKTDKTLLMCLHRLSDSRLNWHINKYTSKLSTGSHTITVKFDDGEVETGLTIMTASSSAEPTSPQTGDSSHIGLWFALMCLSIAGLITLLISSRKKKARS